MNKALLFGGSGFIGTHLINSLKNKGYSAVNFDISQPIELSQQENHSFVDIRENIEKGICDSASVIVNLAAVHKTPGHPSNEYFETNILGAKNVCKYATENNITTIVFTSSIAVYGTYEEQKTEDTLPMPDIPYGISKLSAEYIHKLWQQEDPEKRRLIIIRPGIVFGKHEKGNFTRLINSLSKGYFFYPGRKDTKKGCIYVKDLVDLMLNRVEKAPIEVEIINASYESSPSISKIVKTIKRLSNNTRPTLLIPSWVIMLLAKMMFYGLGKKAFHPERIRKLTISNDICGKKMASIMKPKYGLELGIKDWLEETDYKTKSKV